MKNTLTLLTESNTQEFQSIMKSGSKFIKYLMIVSALCSDVAPFDPETYELKNKQILSTSPHIYD